MCLSLRNADRGNDPVGKMSGAGPGATADETNLKVKLSVDAKSNHPTRPHTHTHAHTHAHTNSHTHTGHSLSGAERLHFPICGRGPMSAGSGLNSPHRSCPLLHITGTTLIARPRTHRTGQGPAWTGRSSADLPGSLKGGWGYVAQWGLLGVCEWRSASKYVVLSAKKVCSQTQGLSVSHPLRCFLLQCLS